MNQIGLITANWTAWNGFTFKILHLDICTRNVNVDSALFGFNTTSRFLYIDVLFFTIKIFDKNERR